MGAEEQIRGYLGFNEADLFANRSGRFSRMQKKKLAEVDQWTNRFLLILSVLVIIGAIWSAVAAFISRDSWSDWILPVILLAVSGWLFSGTRNKVDGTVEKAEGVVNFVKVQNENESVSDAEMNGKSVFSYEMHVGGDAFSNTNPALIEYMQGDIYAVYYTSTTRRILSAELLSKGK